MKDGQNLHLKLQEYADCYAEADPSAVLKEISDKGVEGDATHDLGEVALKYLSVALSYAIKEQAKRVVVSRQGEMEGSCEIEGKERAKLPQPPTGVAKAIVDNVRCITDLGGDSGCATLSYGLRNDSLEIGVSVERSGGKDELTLSLPG